MRLAEVIAEQWFARRLGLPLGWDAGVTSASERRDAIRDAITERALANSPAGRRGARRESWAQLFERAYHQPLQPEDV